MNAFLHHQYEESKRVFLENLAYMNRQIDEYAEQNGGAEALTEDKKRIYEGRRNRLIRLVAFHDRSQEYVEELQQWINDLISEKRQLTEELKSAQTGWIKFFPRLETPTYTESHKEHLRQLSIKSAQLIQPELF